MSLKIFDLCFTLAPPEGLLSLMSKDSFFNTINALQILFNYFCPFKSYLGVLALSKDPVYLDYNLFHKSICISERKIIFKKFLD